MEVYTIGFAQKTAEQFFGALRQAGIKQLLDVRLSNSSQLAGFTKKTDLPFFLREICEADYVHEPMLAPSPELFNYYKKQKGTWDEYERRFLALMAERKVEDKIDRSMFDVPTVLLCTEPTARRCHRRLVLEYLQSKWGNFDVVHL